jgi:hypothetical protein
MFKKKPVDSKDQYTDDAESLLSHSGDGPSVICERRKTWRFLTVIILLCSYVAVAAVAAWFVRTLGFDKNAFCSRYTSQYCAYDYDGIGILLTGTSQHPY